VTVADSSTFDRPIMMALKPFHAYSLNNSYLCIDAMRVVWMDAFEFVGPAPHHRHSITHINMYRIARNDCAP